MHVMVRPEGRNGSRVEVGEGMRGVRKIEGSEGDGEGESIVGGGGG